jgi:para-aminobenzoate synthetase / 4-amino-4-deoxychorismate lyase
LAVRAVLGSDPVSVSGLDGDPFSLLELRLEVGLGEAAVGGGWIGWLGYGLGAQIERLPPSGRSVLEEPIDFSRLARADAIFLPSSISGWHPALLMRARHPSTAGRLCPTQAGTGELSQPRSCCLRTSASGRLLPSPQAS